VKGKCGRFAGYTHKEGKTSKKRSKTRGRRKKNTTLTSNSFEASCSGWGKQQNESARATKAKGTREEKKTEKKQSQRHPGGDLYSQPIRTPQDRALGRDKDRSNSDRGKKGGGWPDSLLYQSNKYEPLPYEAKRKQCQKGVNQETKGETVQRSRKRLERTGGRGGEEKRNR